MFRQVVPIYVPILTFEFWPTWQLQVNCIEMILTRISLVMRLVSFSRWTTSLDLDTKMLFVACALFPFWDVGLFLIDR